MADRTTHRTRRANRRRAGLLLATLALAVPGCDGDETPAEPAGPRPAVPPVVRASAGPTPFDGHLYRITSSPSAEQDPAIDGHRVVWMDSRNGGGNEDIYLFDLATGTESPVVTATGRQWYPDISGDRVVWADQRNGSWDVYLHDLGSGTESRVTFDGADKADLAIDGDWIVWTHGPQASADIRAHNLATGTTVAVTSDAHPQRFADVSGDRVVWEDHRNGSRDIYVMDLVSGVETQLSPSTSTQQSPKIDGDLVVWNDRRHGQWDIYGIDLTTMVETRYTTDPAAQVDPVTSGSLMAWRDLRSGSQEIWARDLAGGAEVRLAGIDGPIAPWRVDISGNRIVWDALSGDDIAVLGFLPDAPYPMQGGVPRRLAAGYDFTCTIRGDTTIDCWGENGLGQASPPAGTGFDRITAGATHACALRTDGTAACWGNDADGQATPPTGVLFAEISAAMGGHTCAVDTGGALHCWGSNFFGQRNAPGGSDFLSVAAGSDFNCARRANGAVECWGGNSHGQSVPTSGLGTVQVDGGGAHACAIEADRSIECWGGISSYVLDAPGGTDHHQISVGQLHSCTLRGAGAVACWGLSADGRLNSPSSGTYVEVAAGGAHACALRDDGEVVCWGDDSAGQSTPPESLDSDGDGVPDPDDVCPGYDDGLDGDGDGTPDGCDPVFDGDLVLTTQAEVEYWMPLTRVTGRLALQGSDIASLAPFAGLSRVDGDLFLYQTTVSDLTPLGGLTRVGKLFNLRENPNLTSLQGLGPSMYMKAMELRSNPALATLDGFPDLTRIWGIALVNNPALTDIGALDGLAQVDDYLFLQGSGALTSLTGLEAVTRAGKLTLSYMHGLTDLAGLDAFAQGQIVLTNNTQLTSLDPLPLTSSRGIELAHNPALVDISAVAGVTSLQYSLIVNDNDALTDLSPFSTLGSIGQDFLIRGNEALSALTGLDNLVSVGNRLYLEDNPVLADCSAIRDLLQGGVGGQTFISGNAFGCATYDEIVLGVDEDGDGVPDGDDVCPGFDDTADADGDGVPDGCDAFPDDPTEWVDTDGDGVGDSADEYPLDPTGGTPTGTGVTVTPNDQSGNPAGTTLTFDQVDAPGETSVAVSSGGPPPPTAFRLGSPPVYYDVTTTAVFSGAIEICFDYSAQTFNNENNLKLLHDDGSGWTDVTTSLDTDADVICGSTTSLSPFVVTELNVAPEVTTVSLPADPVAVGTSVDLSAAFIDGNTQDTHTGAFDWGAGPVSGIVSESGGSGTLDLAQAFATPGVFAVEAVVTDGDLEGRRSSLLDEPGYVVVYDPTGSFVTGGGWIDSPAGACSWTGCDASTTGKANFGFVAKYRRGANVPTGETQFRFKAGDLDFRSTHYDWLVVAGARAQFKGVGEIGGLAGYGFLLTGIDGDVQGGQGVDRFRIKIWDLSTETVVYDNQRGSDDTSNASTALGGGSIQIHR